MTGQETLFGSSENMTLADKVDMVMMMHFPEGGYRCRNCIDYKIRACDGDGLVGFKKVRQCMVAKARDAGTITAS